jgi:thioredoxin 1
MIQHLTSKGDFVEALMKHRVVLLDVHAAWCAPCKRMKPVLAELAMAMPNVAFLAVEVEQLDEFGLEAIRREVNAVPTLMLFKEGKRVDTNYGFMERQAMAEWIAEHAA